MFAESFLERFTPNLVPIRDEIIAIGIIERVTSPSANFEKNAKAACANTKIDMEGKSSLTFLPIKHFSAVANNTTPPMPIDELIAPIKIKVK